jgi:hypothetical protein
MKVEFKTVKIKDNFEVWCHIYLAVSKWVTQQSYSASRGKAYMAACVQCCRNASLCVFVTNEGLLYSFHCYMRNRMHSPNIKIIDLCYIFTNEYGADCRILLKRTYRNRQ